MVVERSRRLFCIVACCLGLCSIVLGCVKLVGHFSVVNDVQQASVVSDCFKLFASLVF